MQENEFESFASFLDDDNKQTKSQKENTGSFEEDKYKKLAFLWNDCLPEEGALDIWSKTKAKMADNSLQVESAGNKIKRVHWLRVVGYGVAASIAILIGVAYFYQNNEKRIDLASIAANLQSKVAQDSLTDVTLVVSNDRKIALNNNAKIVYSANGQVSVNSDQLKEANVENAFNQIIVPKGKRSQIVLADNSKIWINSGSKVIYPRSFEGKYREIYVEGEIYLKVAHNEDMPFIVNTSGFEVRVLGTSFNVTAYRGSTKASIVLVEGAVDVKDQTNRHIKMNPNERVELDQAVILGKKKVNVYDYISWVDGIWTLNGESLKEVVQRLEDYYGQTIILSDPSIGNELMYGKLFLNNNLNEIMKSIASILPLKYTMKENRFYIEYL